MSASPAQPPPSTTDATNETPTVTHGHAHGHGHLHGHGPPLVRLVTTWVWSLVAVCGVATLIAVAFLWPGGGDGVEIDPRGILLAGVVIGALGALDDVTVTQVSAVWELDVSIPNSPRRN